MSYIYEGHMGSIYISDEYLDYDDLYCDTCGDSDSFIAEVNTVEDLLDAIYQLVTYCSFDPAYVEEFIEENFPEVDIIVPPYDLPDRKWHFTGYGQTPIYCELDTYCDHYFDDDGFGTLFNYYDKNFEYELNRANKYLDKSVVLN